MTDHTISLSDTAPEGARSDSDLVLRTRSGDAGAYAELWRRHYGAGMAVARSITSTFEPDDLVQEAFARVYQAIQKGGGPTGSFRAYLFTSIRNTAAGWGRARREAPIDELDTVADPSSTDQAANEALDRSLSAQAFRSLPSRWQEVLWYSEIEQMKPAEIAPLLGMTAGATAQLAFRAREGLREAWIQAHLSTAEPGSVCEWTIERLGAYSRGNLGARDRKKLENHLGECARCLIVAAEAKEVSHRLAFVLLPLVLGIGGSGAYLAMLQSGSAPVVALAAMPSSVVQGAVVAGSAGAGAAGAAAHGTAGAAGSAGSGGSSGGGVAGLGALVGAGSAALVIAGAIVAAAVVPGFTANPASTSAPSASDQGDSSIVAQVSPPTSVPLAPPAPVEPSPDPAPRPEKPKTVVTIPVDTTAKTEPASNAAPVAPPVTPVEPEKPGDGTGTPGGGTGTPGDGGTGTPGDGGTGTNPTDPDPSLPPAAAPVLGTAALSCRLIHSALHDSVEVSIEVSGVPGATVRPSADVVSTGDAKLNSDGKAVVVFFPTFEQVNGATKVSLTYVLGDKTGGSAVFDLGRFAPVSWPQCWLNPPAPIPGDPATAPAPTPPPASETTPTGPAEADASAAESAPLAPEETAPEEPAPVPAESTPSTDPVAPGPDASPAPEPAAPTTDQATPPTAASAPATTAASPEATIAPSPGA